MILRPYQQDAIDAFFAHVKLKEYSGIISAPPTGSGKSAILADICKTLLTLSGTIRKSSCARTGTS